MEADSHEVNADTVQNQARARSSVCTRHGRHGSWCRSFTGSSMCARHGSWCRSFTGSSMCARHGSWCWSFTGSSMRLPCSRLLVSPCKQGHARVSMGTQGSTPGPHQTANQQQRSQRALTMQSEFVSCQPIQGRALTAQSDTHCVKGTCSSRRWPGDTPFALPLTPSITAMLHCTHMEARVNTLSPMDHVDHES